jgi:nucleoside-diphosphate-sugar epimerase/putative sterol carrier protein
VKIAVTGGSGQLGTVVLRRLLAERGVKAVRCLDLQPPLVASARLEHVRADVRAAGFERHLEGFDALVHLAFVVTGYRPRAEFDEINVGGSRNVLGAAARAGLKQIVYASSIAAYGVSPGQPVPLVEDSPRVHVRDFPYSSAKWEVEEWLDREFEPQHRDIALARFRPGIFIGAPTLHAFGRMLDRGLLVDGPAMPLVWDEDVAEAMVLALRKKAHGAYNLVAEPPTPTPQIARTLGLRLIRVPEKARLAAAFIGDLAARIGAASVDPAWLRYGMSPMIAAADKARMELGWTPKCPTPTSVIERYLEEAAGGLDRRLDLFFRTAQLMSRVQPPPEGRHMNARVHLRLTGKGGGDLGLVMEGGRLTLSRTPPRPPTVVVTMKAATMKELLGGQLEFTTAQLTGKVRVDGEALAALVVQALVATFRERAPKRVQRLLFKGANA